MRFQDPFLLSLHGSTRATAYGFSNKSVTVDGRTHVVWLDAVAEVRGRTYDWDTAEWSPTHSIFTGSDNHTSPALTVDRDRHIHIAGGPHGYYRDWNQARFRWLCSREPNSLAVWGDDVNFGYNATYACMEHSPQDIDMIAYRGGEEPRSLMFQRQRKLGHWTTARELMRQEIVPQYTHNGAHLAVDAAGTVYVAGHFFNVGGSKGPKRSYGVGMLRSMDQGESWTSMSGDAVTVPTLYGEHIALPPYGADVRMNGVNVDSTGKVWALVSSTHTEDPRLLLCRWEQGRWQTTDLGSALPDGWVGVDAVLTMGVNDRIHLAVTALQPALEESGTAFGNASCEVFHILCHSDGTAASCTQVSSTDGTVASWLPNISQPGPYCPFDAPVILFTHGTRGEGCLPTTESEVYCVLPAE